MFEMWKRRCVDCRWCDTKALTSPEGLCIAKDKVIPPWDLHKPTVKATFCRRWEERKNSHGMWFYNSGGNA